MLKLDYDTLMQIENDLGVNFRFAKDRDIPVRNAWHYSTDGTVVDALFYDEDDFKDGMNRSFFMAAKYRVVVLAFVLMSNHVHFILYGAKEECDKFMHEYVRLTSLSIFFHHGERNKLRGLPISCQAIDTDAYLKTAICYVLRNPVVAGKRYTYFDYPWGSGALLFRNDGSWTKPVWPLISRRVSDYTSLREYRKQFRSHFPAGDEVEVVDDMVLPSEFVQVELVEKLFRTPKSLHHFMAMPREVEVESRAGAIADISLSDTEMRQHRDEICQQLFGRRGIRELDTTKRVRLAKMMRQRFNSSVKQIARLTGLKYEDLRTMI